MVEVEALRASKVTYEAEIAALKSQLLAAQNTNEMDSKVAAAESEASKRQQEAKSLQEKCNDLTKTNKDLEVKLNDLNRKVKLSQEEASSLAEENERLSEQVASSLERPVAEGQEANNKQNGVENGHSSAVEESKKQMRVNEEEMAVLKKKYTILLQEKETL